MKEKNVSQQFRFKNIDETRNYFLEEIEPNELMERKHKQVCTITGCISISASVSLLGIPIGTMSSAIGLKICAIVVRFKKYNSIIKKKEKNYDKIVLLAKTKLNSIEVLICRALVDLNISHDEFVLILRACTVLKFLKKKGKSFRCTGLLSSSKLVHLRGKTLTCFNQNPVQKLTNLVLMPKSKGKGSKMHKIKTIWKNAYMRLSDSKV